MDLYTANVSPQGVHGCAPLSAHTTTSAGFPQSKLREAGTILHSSPFNTRMASSPYMCTTKERPSRFFEMFRAFYRASAFTWYSISVYLS